MITRTEKTKKNRELTHLVTAATATLALGLAGCGKTGEQTVTEAPVNSAVVVEPARVVRPEPTRTILSANVAVTLAVNQYVYARLLTDELATGDYSKTSSSADVTAQLLDAEEAWGHADVAIDGALLLAGHARNASEQEEGKAPPEGDREQKTKTGDKSAPDRTFEEDPQADAESDFGTAMGTPIADAGGNAWMEPFTDYFEPVDEMTILGRLILELQEDSALTQSKLADLSADLSGVPAQDIPDVITTAGLHQTPKVGLYVTSTAIPEGGSVQPLQSTADEIDADSFVVSGVDALAIMGTGSSKILLGYEKQVVVVESDLGEDPGSFSAVIGFVDLDPTRTGAISAVEDLKNPLVQVGKDPDDWFLADEILAVEVEERSDNSAELEVRPVPKGSTPQQRTQNLRQAGVRQVAAPRQTLPEIAQTMRADPKQVTQVIEIIIKVVDEAAPSSPSDVEQGIEEAPERTDAGRVGTRQVSGTYTMAISSPDNNLSTTATVVQNGSGMTITFVNDFGATFVFKGSYDETTGVFVLTEATGSHPEHGDNIPADVSLDLVFDQNANPITATGTGVDASSSVTVTLTRTDD